MLVGIDEKRRKSLFFWKTVLYFYLHHPAKKTGTGGVEMKRWVGVLLVLALVLTGCGGSSKGGKVAVFWYSFDDAYLSEVRASLNEAWEQAGIDYQNYDAESRQANQNEQIRSAINGGASALVVNIVDASLEEPTREILEMARQADIPIVFFNRSVSEALLSTYKKAAYVGTNYEQAGHMQGEMIGRYLADHFEELDLNKDRFLSYVMFKGQEGNAEAAARTKYAVEDANVVLATAGQMELRFYDATNGAKYLVDQYGAWSFEQAKDYMTNILRRYTEENGSMVEVVIANNDAMALGAVAALQEAGYNNGTGKTIPVFGVDATKDAQKAIAEGTMTGTIRQDSAGMAQAVAVITQNLQAGKATFDGLPQENVVSSQRINIPYSLYTGEE